MPQRVSQPQIRHWIEGHPGLWEDFKNVLCIVCIAVLMFSVAAIGVMLG